MRWSKRVKYAGVLERNLNKFVRPSWDFNNFYFYQVLFSIK